MPDWSYLSRRKMPLPAPKKGCLMMRIRNKDWWEVVLLHLTVAEWTDSFIMTGHAFIQPFIQNEELLTVRVILHMLFLRQCTCAVLSVSVFNLIECLHARSIGSIKVFTRSFFSPIEPSILLQTDYLVAFKRSRCYQDVIFLAIISHMTFTCQKTGSPKKSVQKRVKMKQRWQHAGHVPLR